MRHAVQRAGARALADPAAAAIAAGPALTQQVFAAFCRARQHVAGLAVAVKPQQREDCSGAAAHDVQLFVGGDQVVGEQKRGIMGVGQ